MRNLNKKFRNISKKIMKTVDRIEERELQKEVGKIERTIQRKLKYSVV